MNKSIGFVGAGSIAEALIRGLLSAPLVKPEQIAVCNRSNTARLQELEKRYDVRIIRDKDRLVRVSDVLVLATKPKDSAHALAEIGRLSLQGRVVISVVAGVRTDSVERLLGEGVQVVRAMPNTSCHVRESATAISSGRSAGEQALQLAVELFSCVGKVSLVPEEMLDPVTGLSGSGPAYVYLLMEAMIEGGVQQGLPPGVSRDLAVQTVLGAAKMAAETGEDPELLRHRVTSPGGTTLAGLQVLAERGFNSAVTQAISRATARSRELGRGLLDS